MTLALVFVDEHGAPVGGDPGGPGPGSTFVPAVHRRTGVTQPDVPGKSGSGLAMWGWLRGLRFG